MDREVAGEGRRSIIALMLGALLTTQDAAAAGDALGRALYTNCAPCHGRSGEGGFAPALAHNPHLADPRYVLSKIRRGSAVMPPFGEQLTGREIAAVVAFLRSPELQAHRP